MLMRSVPMLFLACSLLLTSCFSSGGYDDPKEEVKVEEEKEGITISDGDSKITINSDGLEESLGNLIDALSTKDEDGEAIGAVDFSLLKKQMPQKIAGMKRVKNEGRKAGMLGFNFSVAEAEYEGANKSLDVSIVDVAGVGMLTSLMAAWTDLEMDSETEYGYERTTEMNGFPAFEQYDSRREEGQVSLFVDDRFIISIEGNNISEKDLRKAINAIDLKSLSKM